jgi:LIM homeobox protein 3/4
MFEQNEFHVDLSNDSYSTVNMGLDDCASPHSGRGSYIHSPQPYLSNHSPNNLSHNHNYAYSESNVYAPLGNLSIKLIY